MPTSVLVRADKSQTAAVQQNQQRVYAASLISALTAAALVIHGFHPYAEDGGLYLAGVKRMLDPALYQQSSVFVLGHLRFSLFAPAMAWLVRTSGLELVTIALLVHMVSIWLTLAAAWMLAGRCFKGTTQRTGAVALLTAWLTLPIAGTSLMLMDPYVTARSISTPLTIFALAWAIDFFRSTNSGGRWNWRALSLTAVSLAIAAAAHPLMAAYGFGCVLTLATSVPRRREARLLAVGALGAAAVLAALVLRMIAQPETAAYQRVAMSRYYWFLSQWHWYELVGAIAPVAILAAAAWLARSDRESGQYSLGWMGVTAGSIAMLTAAMFARVSSTNHLVARMQPMRIFQLVYIVMIVLLGGALARWMGKSALRWSVTFAVLIGVMALNERMTFPASDRVELAEDEGEPANNWVQAFEWIRKNTPKDAMFALDADYITRKGEDAQSFRAIAERSALPDYSKDGGEAAITPGLADAWKAGEEAQSQLSERSDEDRIATLAPKQVSWVVLESKAVTSLPCDYTNAAVKVCRLQRGDTADGLRFSLRQPALPQEQTPQVQR